MSEITYMQVVWSLVLVAIAIGVGFLRRLPVFKDMALGTVRTFVQLIAVGYALDFIFNLENLWLVALAIAIMITVGAQAGASHVKSYKGAFPLTWISISIGSVLTLAMMLVIRIIPLDARYIIPLGGMIISNSMNATALTIDRLSSDLKGNRLAVETALALGKNWREASSIFQRKATTTGMMSILNFMKTVGIVALPGAMTGMILAGADPIDAVLLQVIVGYMLLSSVTISSVVATELTVRRFFTPFHQLRQDI
jgi:putative ABC transport system permease protein